MQSVQNTDRSATRPTCRVLRKITRTTYHILACCAVIIFCCNNIAAQQTYELTDLTLRMGEEGGGVIFNRIADFDISNRGDYYILDNRDHLISVFDRNGVFQYCFGRNGQGPGEFIQPTKIKVQQDTIFVLDAVLNRITEFTNDGSYIRSYHSPGSLTDFVVNNNLLYVASTSESIITEIKRPHQDQRRSLLSYSDLEVGQLIRESYGADVPTLCLFNNTLLVGLQGYGIIINISLVNYDEYSILIPQSTSISTFINNFIREHGDWRTNPTVSVPAVLFENMQPWSENTILLDAHNDESSHNLVSLFIVIDLDSGTEVGPRIGSTTTNYHYFRRIERNRIVAINRDLVTLDVFQITTLPDR